jgi:aminoglycoside phosphotransferase family enzyme/predicted kinase
MMQDMRPPASQAALIAALALELARAGQAVERYETHISWVLVAGGDAYKFKKAIRLGFLDCSTLAARCHYCEEELRLNRRLCPGLYLNVVSITGDPAHPSLGGAGEAIEYAVHMRAFGQQALWTQRLADGRLSVIDIDGLALLLARFHQQAAPAPADSPWGTLPAFAAPADQTMIELGTLLTDPSGRGLLSGLQAWDIRQRHCLALVFARRKSAGMVRECHGDLHSGNILTTERGVEAFDCIEFSEALRWIDVMNDLAFICMDLAFRQRRDLSARLRNEYLALTGDYEGLAVLRFYGVHRALVRSMVFLMQAGQAQNGSPAAAYGQQGLAYLAYAFDAARPAKPAILITHGYSGSGKTTLSRHVVEVLGAIQLRSDVERKRMHGLKADDRSGSGPGSALYDAAASERTYARLLELARAVAEAGFVVIVDAAFLASAQRARFAQCAAGLGIPFFIFDIQASPAAMVQRLAARAAAGTDASDAAAAVLARQLATAEPLSAAERTHAIVVDAETGIDRAAVAGWCKPVAHAIAMPPGEPAARRE